MIGSRNTKRTAADTRAALYMAAAYMGAAGTALLIAAELVELPDLIAGFAIGILLVSLVLLLRRKLRDEYFDRLWNAGTSFAFVAAVALFLFTPFLGGFVDGVTRSEIYRELPGDVPGALVIMAFFIGFHLARFRGH